MTSVQITDSEFKLIRDFIEESCGISVGNEKSYLIESRLAGLLRDSGSNSFSEFYKKASEDRTSGLRDKIVDAMTTNETLWFRDKSPFRIFEEIILPKVAEEFKAGKRNSYRIWSAACSTGQEPYSLIMTALEYAAKNPSFPVNKIEIIATDISPSALFLAMAGRYDQLSISRGLPQEMKDKYFSQKGKIWILNDKVKQMVKFKKFNLQESFMSLGRFDLVLCRNVAIYFSDSFKKELFRKIAGILNPNSYFLLGASESLGGYNTDFEMKTLERSIYYLLK